MNSINKKQMIRDLAVETKTNQANVKLVWETFVAYLTRHMIAGDRLSIDGFGTFEAATLAARLGRNPATGEAMQLEERKAPKLKFGKNIKDYVSGKEKFKG